MKRLILVCAVLVASTVSAQERRGPPGGPGNSYANPSAVIAAELAFAQAAKDKGQWTAFAESAAPDAVMLVPQMVWAQTWLKGRANPPQALRWQPYEVWSSCDGSLVVSHGAWQGAKGAGYFTTLWRRQPDGAYKWIFDHGDSLKEPLAAPEMLAAHVADCPERARRPDGKGDKQPKQKKVRFKDLPPLDPTHRAGAASDGSLKWDVTVEPSGARKLSITWKKDGQDQTLLSEQVAAEKHAGWGAGDA